MSTAERHYVYACYVDDELKYVGHGIGARFKHCTSGRSSCGELNRDFYAGKKIEVKKLYKGLSKVQAEEIEENLIRESFDSLYNKVFKYEQPPAVPNVSKKKNFKILAKTFSIDNEEDYFKNFLANIGLEGEDLMRIQDVLIQTGLSIYIVQHESSKPMIVIDKTKESDYDNWEYRAFGHLAHPEGLWDVQTGIEMELGRY